MEQENKNTSDSNLPKFELIWEADQAYIVHNYYPKCKAMFGDDDDLFDEHEWQDEASDSDKENIIKEMTEWNLEEQEKDYRVKNNSSSTS